jgi:hypothetical protein
MPNSTLHRTVKIVAAVALAGWIWAFSNVGMPDALWLVTVALTLVAIVLGIVALLRRGNGGPSHASGH